MRVSSPVPSSAAAERVVVVGAGPAGMATAIELAQHGVPSVVLEKRGMEGTRAPLFAVAPPFADRLAALDETGALAEQLTPVDSMYSLNPKTGARVHRPFDGELSATSTRSRGDMDALLAAVGDPKMPGADHRRWSFVGIDDVDNALRELATTRYKDLIDLRTNAGVAELRQGDGWAEAVLEPAADGAARDAVRGAMLVDATGRDLLASSRTTYPETTSWVGARFAGNSDGEHVSVRIRDAQGDGTTRTSISLPARDRSIVWTQVDGDPGAIDPAEARALIKEQAPRVGVTAPLADDAPVMPVKVQLWTSNEPARGRILKVGDSLRAPYFMTSTGAATALVHDAPRAVDTILAVRDGMPVAQAVGAYSDAVMSANAKLIDVVRPRLLKDAGVAANDAGAPVVGPPAPRGR